VPLYKLPPGRIVFQAEGDPLVQLEEVSLDLDELEAIRLADYEGQYHEQAAR